PIVGVEPGIKPAAERTRTGVVGVLATRQTLASQSYNCLKQRVASDARLLEQACPDFVSLVERGHLCGDDTREAVERYVGPLLDAGADQIVLGCTHFSFLAPEISKFCGDGVELIDTASPVANELLRRISDDIAESPALMSGDLCFWRSKVPALDDSMIRELWGQEISVETILL
ncbi:MAG: aspartate/glutamate racemase family protein, partial [Pseudomonadota bacterium]|nr:aspartate/glutamate racemase family protein [Pseudomonadota bacterium]